MASRLNTQQGIQIPHTWRQQFAESFYVWELQGRGGQVFDYETKIEPIFLRFELPRSVARPIDDGRMPSLFGRLFSNRENANSLPKSERTAVNNFARIEPLPTRLPVNTASFRTHLPSELKISSEQTEQLLLNLAYSASLISFEVIGTEREIILQISCPAHESKAVLSQLKSHLPNINFRETEDALEKDFQPNRTSEFITADFGLGKEWFIPLPPGKTFATDTLLPLVASFEEMTDGEIACLQILFSRARGHWQQAAQEALFDRSGKLVFADLQNYSAGIREKLSKPLLAVQIRFAAGADSQEKALKLARKTGAFFRQFSAPNQNELIPLQNNDLGRNKHLQSMLSRTTYRTGMLLSAEELAAIVHLPSDSIKSQKLSRDENRTRLAPEFAALGNVRLGENLHAGQKRIVRLSNMQRLKHMWVTGASGCGKSTLITNLAAQDFEAGNGGFILEPHGDLIESVVARIPEHRLKDVILFDAADEDFPIGFNPLHAGSELERTLLSSDLVSIFQRFWTSQGDIISNVLHNAVLTFLSSASGGTLVELKHFLVDKKFREQYLETVEDDEIRFYWSKEFPPLAGRITPLLTRLNLFLRSKLIRNIIAQTDNKLDFRRIMDERKILLVKLTHGAIGEENARLLGSFIIAKLYQAALSRQNAREECRHSFFVSADEAHHFLVPSMALLLSGGRKYGVGLLVSHQDTQQITSRDADILSSLMTNCYARICFRSDADAEKAAKGFSFFTAEHLKNLGVGEAVCRFEQSRYDFNLKTFPLESVSSEIAERRKQAVIEYTRENYAKPKAQVEEEIRNGQQTTNVINSVDSYQNNTPTNDDTIKLPDEIGQSAELSVPENTIDENQGRGGRHHQELQAVIKRMAESYGFSVEIEKSVLGGTGSVDVSIEKENLKIACEVSVTSTTDYETHNILKCLAAGYDYAAVIVSNQKKLPSLNAKLRSEIPAEQTDKVKTFGLTGLLEFLRQLAAPKETTSKKREVKNGQRLNLIEASEFLNISSSALYRWAREGRVPFYRVGREYRFDRDELVLIGKHDLSGKRKASVKLEPLKIEKNAAKGKKRQHERYRKMLKL